MIEHLDIRILALLQKDARAPQKNIAADLDISEPTLSKRINRLMADGIIRRQTIDIDLSKIGLSISAMTLLKERHQSDTASTQPFLCGQPEAYQVHKITGDWDYAILWNCTNPEHLDTVLTKVVQHSNVEKIQTFLFMRSLKRESGASLEALLEAGHLKPASSKPG